MADDRKEGKMKVVSINDAPKKNDETEVIDITSKKKEALLDILNHMKEQIESGQIQEFVATSLDKEGEAQIHCYVGDVAVGVGLFEIGKNILMTQYNGPE
jgi:Ni,Fe-hydrogenase I large subunit